jgi:hypothetical protein
LPTTLAGCVAVPEIDAYPFRGIRCLGREYVALSGALLKDKKTISSIFCCKKVTYK